jgi:hypothetical protein
MGCALSPMMNYDLGQSFQFARRYDEAIAEYRKTLVLDPNFAASHHWLGLSLLLERRNSSGDYRVS